MRYYTVGTGYCRGLEGNCQRVNGRVHLDGDGLEAGCAAACTATGAACVGYSFHSSFFFCYNYGPGLDEGLEAVSGDSPLTTAWAGYSQSNSVIGSADGSAQIVCKSKTAVAPTPPSPPCCGGGTVENLDEYSSPISWTTSGTGDNYELSCGGHGNEYMVYYALPTGHTIDIGMDHNSCPHLLLPLRVRSAILAVLPALIVLAHFSLCCCCCGADDSRHETSWGGSCPGAHVVQCTDDPDTRRHQWTNDQGSTQNVFFVIDAYSSGSGSFQLSWTISSGGSSGLSMQMGGSSRSVQVRLIGTETRGMLQMNVDGQGWGAVCDDGFNGDEARAFCAQLGYPGVGVSYDTTHGDSSFAADDIHCPSGATGISSCSTNMQPYSDNCADSETVGLDCSSEGTGDACSGGATVVDAGALGGTYGNNVECVWSLSCSDTSDSATIEFSSFDVRRLPISSALSSFPPPSLSPCLVFLFLLRLLISARDKFRLCSRVRWQ